VINGATSISATDVGNGQTYSATVVGYDRSHDIALIQLNGASGLTTAKVGDSSTATVGQAVVAVGNAGGVGGTPSAAGGSLVALDQQITASDQGSGTSEQLSGLIQTNADIQPGDSGGALVNANGQVVGMNAAASSGNGGFGFGQSGNEGYAIPIENALSIAKRIASGQGGANIHVGGNRAMLGIAVLDSGTGASRSSAGATVQNVQSGSAAAGAGIEAGAVITGLGDATISSARDLTHALIQYQPKDSVTVTWLDTSGASHHATVQLGSGPPA
jgi:S1-C subfamily serine protease